MQKIVFLFVAAAAFIGTATALECYACDGQICQDDISKWTKVPACGKTVDTNHLGACLKRVYTDKTTSKEMTIRKCVIAEKDPKGAPKFNCGDTNGPTVTCEVCNTDLCNSAPAINLSAVTFLGIVATILFSRIL